MLSSVLLSYLSPESPGYLLVLIRMPNGTFQVLACRFILNVRILTDSWIIFGSPFFESSIADKQYIISMKVLSLYRWYKIPSFYRP